MCYRSVAQFGNDSVQFKTRIDAKNLLRKSLRGCHVSLENNNGESRGTKRAMAGEMSRGRIGKESAQMTAAGGAPAVHASQRALVHAIPSL